MKTCFKSVLPFILGLLLLGVSSCEYAHLDGSPLTLEEAIEKSKKIWNQYDIVFAMKDVIDPGTTFHLAFSANGKYQEISPDYDAWLIYADTNPHANGGIHYLWIFVNCKTGKMETINTSSEPYPDWEEERLINRAIPVKVTDEYKGPGQQNTERVFPTKAMSIRPSSVGNDWAVIISGGHNKESNWMRYWNDCSLIYKVLTQQYNYDKSRVLCLISDGTNSGNDRRIAYTGIEYYDYDSSPTDLDGDNVADVQYAATLTDLSTVFSYLGSNVQSGDNVFIYVIDHGDHDGTSSYISLWNETRLYPSQFATMVNQIDSGAKIHFVLGQCKSGGFIPALTGTNRSIATACTEYENSSAYSLYSYDVFVFQWTTAMAGYNFMNNSSVNADENQDGLISFSEAFAFARDNDIYAGYPSYSESPLFTSTPALFGAHYDLNGNYSYVPQIVGDSDITSSYSSTYYVSDQPSGSTVNWSLIIGLNESSLGSGDIKYIYNCYSSLPYAASRLKMSLTHNGVTYTDQKEVGLWVPGNIFNNSLIQDNGFSFSLWENPFGATDFVWATDDSDLIIQYQGYYFTEYEMLSGTDPSYSQVWVSFINPLGENTTVIRME